MVAGLLGERFAAARIAHEDALHALHALVRRRRHAAAVRALDAALAANARHHWLRARAFELVEVVRQPLAEALHSSSRHRRRRARALLPMFAHVLEQNDFNARRR